MPERLDILSVIEFLDGYLEVGAVDSEGFVQISITPTDSTVPSLDMIFKVKAEDANLLLEEISNKPYGRIIAILNKLETGHDIPDTPIEEA